MRRMIPEKAQKYIKDLATNHPDPSASWGGSGSDYTAGDGIDITDGTISIDYGTGLTVSDETLIIDTSTVALKSEIPAAVSGTNDGTNWTSLTIGSNTYGIDSGIKTYGLTLERLHELYPEAPSGGLSVFPLSVVAECRELPVFLDKTFDNDLNQQQQEDLRQRYDTFIDLPNSEKVNVKGLFGIVRIVNNAVPVQLFYTNNSDSNLNEKTFTMTRVGDYDFQLDNARYGKANLRPGIANQYEIKGIASTGTGRINISGDSNKEDIFESYAYIGVVNPVANVNYANQLKAPTATGNYILGASVDSSSNPTFSWDTKPTLATVATTGDYDDLINKPTIPTDTADLTNGAGYITGIDSTDVTIALGYTPGTSNFSGDYTDLTNTPSIPTTATSTSSVTPSTVQLTFTYSDNTTETITLMTGASVSTTTTLS